MMKRTADRSKRNRRKPDGIVDGFVQPTTIKAFLRAKEIKLTWQPPLHTKRGKMMYRIEWREKLKPAAETKKAETKVHIYTIKKLKPNTEYDIRVLAFVPGTLPAEPGEEKVSEAVLPDLDENGPHLPKIPEGSIIAQAGTEYALMTSKIKEAETIIEMNPPLEELDEQALMEDRNAEPDTTLPILTPKRKEPKKVVFIIINDLYKKSKPLPVLKKTFANLMRLFERDMVVKDDLILKIHNGGKNYILNEFHKITSRKDFFSYSMFMCFIATHGNQEGFNTSDESTISYHELFGLVSQKEWKDFSDKPKIFFIDTCRTKMDKRGLYPKDLQIEELPSHELAVSWSPPELFDHYELNYIVNVYEIDQNKICVKRRELLSLTPSCLLRDLSSKTIYKISVWPVLAKTQKKKGWPNHTKYMIQDIAERNQIQMVASSTSSITISWWLDEEVADESFIAKCRKKGGGDDISEELEIVSGKQQTHMIGYLDSNTTYLVGIYIGSNVYLPEVEFKTKAKLQPENLKVVDVQSFEITVSWDPPSHDYYGISHYLVEYRSKYLIDFVQVSSVPTLKHYKYILTGMEPDVIYKIRVFAEKNKGKGDPTNFVKCRTPKVGPTDLEIKSDTTSITILWNDATLPDEDAKLAYKLSLRYEGIHISNGAVIKSKEEDPEHKYSCHFSDLWTGTTFKLTILTISNDQIWDPPIEMDVKTKKDRNRSGLEPKDNNFVIAYNDSVTTTGKETNGWFMSSIIKNLRNKYLQHDLEDILGFVLEDAPKRQQKKERSPIIISTLNSKVSI